MTTTKQLEKDLKRAKRAVSELKAEASKANFYKQKFKDTTAQKEVAEYDAYIYKIIADVATKGIAIKGQTHQAFLEKESLRNFDAGFRGQFEDAEGQAMPQGEYMKYNIVNFCVLEANVVSINAPVIKYVEALKQHAGLEIPSLKKFCQENEKLLDGFKAPALVVVEEATGAPSMEPAVQDNLPGGSHHIEGGE